MELQKIKLTNITTHENTTIDFQQGINIFAGSNGAGKSSILKMIGYVLFDYLPGKQKDYIRKSPQNPKTGKVTIFFRGKEGEDFSVERMIGQSRIIVKSQPSQTTLSGIHSKAELRVWLKEQLSIEPQFDISNIFKNAIGVEQGTFTAPFLQTPSERRNIFAPLLNVDIYRKIYERYNDINKEFHEELNNQNLKIQALKGELKQNKELQIELREKERRIKNLKEELKTLQNEGKILKKRNNKLMEQKENLDKLHQSLEKIQLQKQNAETSLQSLNKEVKKAQKSKNICVKNQKAYNTFEDLTKEEKELRIQEKHLIRLEQQIKDLQQKQTKITTQKEEIQHQVNEIEAKKKDFIKAKSIYKQDLEIQKQITDLQTKITQNESLLKQIKDSISKQQAIQRKIDILKKNLEKFDELAKEIEIIDQTQEDLTLHEKNLAILGNKKQQLLDNKRASKDGMCPFLHEQCQNIGEGSLTEYFQNKIIPLEKQIKSEQDELNQIKEKLSLLKKHRKMFERLTKKHVEKEGLLKQSTEIEKEIIGLKKQVSNTKAMNENLKALSKQHTSMQITVEQYHYLRPLIEEKLPKNRGKVQALTESLEIIFNKIKPTQEKLEKLSHVRENLQKLQYELEKNRLGHENYQINIKMAKNLPEIKKQITEINNKLNNFIISFDKIQKETSHLEKEFNLEDFEQNSQKLQENISNIASAQGELKITEQNYKEIRRKITILQIKIIELKNLLIQYNELEQINAFSKNIRSWFKESGPKITKALLNSINDKASEIYTELTEDESTQILWKEDFGVELHTPTNIRRFYHLSGGEQMLVALSIRLGILEILTTVDFAFFDEPTTNLDLEKRQNLAECIRRIKGFKQIFVISHDDTFQSSSDYVLNFEKDDEEISHVDISHP
ncbi:MAG: AAA family ATPase [Promethearchaeota archaeon]